MSLFEVDELNDLWGLSTPDKMPFFGAENFSLSNSLTSSFGDELFGPSGQTISPNALFSAPSHVPVHVPPSPVPVPSPPPSHASSPSPSSPGSMEFAPTFNQAPSPPPSPSPMPVAVQDTAPRGVNLPQYPIYSPPPTVTSSLLPSGFSSPVNSPYSSSSSPNSYSHSPSPSPSSDESSSPPSQRRSKEGKGSSGEKDTRKRKRRKYIRQEDVKATTMTLAREKLLAMTLVEMDEFIAKMRATRRLTEEEDQDLKRQRRLVKNRESALASRNRKKEETELLEDQVARLIRENNDHRKKIGCLEAENNVLKNEVMHLNQALGGNTSYGDLMNSFEVGHAGSTKVRGITVMLLLFSFGALLHPLTQDGTMASIGSGKGMGPFPYMTTPLSSAPEVVEQNDDVEVEAAQSQNQWKHRNILGVEQQETNPSPSSTLPESISQPKPIDDNEESPMEVSEITSTVELSEGLRSFANSSEIDDPVLVQILVPRSALSQPITPSVQYSPPSDDLPSTFSELTSPSSEASPISSEDSPTASLPTTPSTVSADPPSVPENATSPEDISELNNLVEVSCRVMNLNSASHVLPKTENLKS